MITMLSYCRRWGERGVRAYTVHPGFVRSRMLSKAAVSTPVRILFTLLSYILGRSEAQVTGVDMGNWQKS